MQLLTEKQATNTANNIISACTDIEKLAKRGYSFIYLASGFIAHYNIHGFKDYYNAPDKLRDDIIANKHSNQWDNFREGEEHYEYYMQKKQIYNQILDKIITGV